MSAVRCPACAAAIPPGAQWCGLCFADLRPAPAPAPAEPPAAVETPAPTAAVPADLPDSSHQPTPDIDPLSAPVALLEQAAGDLPEQRTEAPARGWPCQGCGDSVSFDEDTCPSCGVRFLAGAAQVDPITARLSPHSRGDSWKLLIILVGSIGMVGFLVGLLAVLGTIF